ncbi:hypothetical protein BDV96DRAFT_567507 [Lophiotrema nucula]|uniref:Uncharacterized protein n=1 Tax=Lophiotrema nucula TaxID=690887 RepID=A0A6A5ZKM6_9PLEO|nr:hypothetical protein BDV96DRAFT_567507 [Lophiotrema nucula]
MRLPRPSFVCTFFVGFALLAVFASAQPVHDTTSPVATHPLNARDPKGGGGRSFFRPSFSTPKVSPPKVTMPKPSMPNIIKPSTWKPTFSSPKTSTPKPSIPKIPKPKTSTSGSSMPLFVPLFIPGTYSHGGHYTSAASTVATVMGPFALAGLTGLVAALLL